MLVLTRNPGQSIMIGNHIKVTIVGAPGQVKVGIEAPRNIPVHREEIFERVQEADERAIKRGAPGDD